jgi:hypothetical protein
VTEDAFRLARDPGNHAGERPAQSVARALVECSPGRVAVSFGQLLVAI